MPRYIDADDLIEELRSLQVTVTGIRCGKGYLSTIVREYQKSVLKIVHDQPTTDVVPVEEVERIMKEHIDFRKEEGDVRAEVALEQALSEIIKATKGE